MKTLRSFRPLQKKAVIFTGLMFAVSVIFTVLHGQALHQVTTDGNHFMPHTLTIQQGDTVRWTNTGLGFHNVRADDDSFRCADGCDGNGGNGNPSAALWTFFIVFNAPGMVAYYCEIHGGPGGIGMSGHIMVQGTAPPMCTNLTSPVNGATAVSTAAAFNWAAAAGNPSGYRLDAGMTPGGTQILNNFDAGNVTSYNPPGNFPNAASIYVKITPYNANGNAANCMEESFTTETCTPNLALNGNPLINGTYSSLGDLTSGNTVIAAAGMVVFTSDTGVVLEQDFTVQQNGIFEVAIQGCSTPGMRGNQ